MSTNAPATEAIPSQSNKDQHQARPAIVVLGASGLWAARRVKVILPEAEIWGASQRLANQDADRFFSDALLTLKSLFQAGRPVIAVCAAGIVIRALASSLTDKSKEPPVLAMAEDGSSVVPLLGGHHGANRLAQRLAQGLALQRETGSHAAITTAGDLRLALALDEPPSCWTLANPKDYKAFTAELLTTQSLRLGLLGCSAGADWLHASSARFDASAPLRITETLSAGVQGSAQELVYIGRRICLGVGCERGTEPQILIDFVAAALEEAGLDEKALAGVFSIDLKADEPAVHALAQHFGIAARFFSGQQLETQAPYLRKPSEVVFAETGCHGVAEGAALAASGSTQLQQPKIIGQGPARGCTLAWSFALQARDPRSPLQDGFSLPGAAQGRLTLVGLGPGGQSWRSHAAQRALDLASDWVGFKMYLDIAAAEGPVTAEQHSFAIGEEADRCRYALDLAAQGRDVALVCSGDPGIFAMSALVLQLLDESDNPAWRRLDLAFEPGITAMQGAVARSGALMGHDFCAISLSDLMTPWEQIERRIAAAAVSDFVVSFYNPVSLRRRWQLERAKALLLKARPADTPVVLGHSIGRPEERIEHLTLGALEVEMVDMLTVVCVGAASSRQIGLPSGQTWAYTPRGYKPRIDAKESA